MAHFGMVSLCSTDLGFLRSAHGTSHCLNRSKFEWPFWRGLFHRAFEEGRAPRCRPTVFRSLRIPGQFQNSGTSWKWRGMAWYGVVMLMTLGIVRYRMALIRME